MGNTSHTKHMKECFQLPYTASSPIGFACDYWFGKQNLFCRVKYFNIFVPLSFVTAT